jgi:dsDNA-binding SOS-regulon protein
VAITIQYVVTHKSEEKLVTTDKKEADQYDKMLDVSDNLADFIKEKCPKLNIAEDVLEGLTIALSTNKNDVQSILKGRLVADLLKVE